MSVEFGVDGGGHRADLHPAAQEGGDAARDIGGMGHGIAVADVEHPELGSHTKNLLYLQQLAAEGLREAGIIDLGAVLPLALEHRALGLEDFADVAFHEDNAVVLRCGEQGQQGSDDLDGLSGGAGEPGVVAPEARDGFELEIAQWVVVVGGARGVGEDRVATGGEHLHHQGGTRAGHARDDGDEHAPVVGHGACGGFGANGQGLGVLSSGFLVLGCCLLAVECWVLGIGRGLWCWGLDVFGEAPVFGGARGLAEVALEEEGEAAVRLREIGVEGDGDLEGGDGVLESAQAPKGDAEGVVRHGVLIEEADGAERGGGGLVRLAALEVGAGEASEGMGVFRIQFERSLEGALGVVGLPEAEAGLAQLDMDPGKRGIGRLGARQAGGGRVGIAFVEVEKSLEIVEGQSAEPGARAQPAQLASVIFREGLDGAAETGPGIALGWRCVG